ncbi:hypothetical protein PENTCL1PPCAC_7605 [Pristionchus entomophagus]|uniref:Uncharacterized protein n=1 Tax=Pristionchus entomophagus TaxID=358040 RepID=A0AAV5SQX3_9BILA|nr:hypothetical protein PENTCL1PPCAC_7605 [Pristionchus entomophagus]
MNLIFDLSGSFSVHAVPLSQHGAVSSQHLFSLIERLRSLAESNATQSVDGRDVPKAHHVVLLDLLAVHGEGAGDEGCEQ